MWCEALDIKWHIIFMLLIKSGGLFQSTVLYVMYFNSLPKLFVQKNILHVICKSGMKALPHHQKVV
jgi:hypothetical protein